MLSRAPPSGPRNSRGRGSSRSWPTWPNRDRWPAVCPRSRQCSMRSASTPAAADRAKQCNAPACKRPSTPWRRAPSASSISARPASTAGHPANGSMKRALASRRAKPDTSCWPPKNCSPVIRSARAFVLRLAGIYGPGRIPHRADLAAGRAIAALPEGHLNLIHVDDAAAAVLAVEAAGHPPRLYLVSDGHPVRRADYLAELARRFAWPAALRGVVRGSSGREPFGERQANIERPAASGSSISHPATRRFARAWRRSNKKGTQSAIHNACGNRCDRGEAALLRCGRSSWPAVTPTAIVPLLGGCPRPPNSTRNRDGSRQAVRATGARHCLPTAEQVHSLELRQPRRLASSGTTSRMRRRSRAPHRAEAWRI